MVLPTWNLSFNPEFVQLASWVQAPGWYEATVKAASELLLLSPFEGLWWQQWTRTLGGAIAPSVEQKKKKLLSVFGFSFNNTVRHNDSDTSTFVDHFTMFYCCIGRDHYMWWVCVGSFVRNKQYQKEMIIMFIWTLTML